MVASHAIAAPDIDREMLLQLVSGSPNGVTLVDETGVVVLWNPAQAQITGIPIDEALGQFIWDVQYRMALPEEQSPAAYDRLRTMILSLLQTGQADWVRPVMERAVRRQDGEIRVLKTRLFALPTAAGFRIASIMRDITAEKHMMNRLNIVSRAIEQAPMSIVITDANEVIQYANPKLLELTGYTLEEVIGQTPRIFKSGLTSPETYQEMWAALSRGQTWRAALQNRKKNGELFWEDMSITPVLDEQGRITHFVAVKEDITHRRQYEEALLKSEQALRQAQAQAHVGDWTWDVVANTVRWSDELCRILGADPAAFSHDPSAVIAAVVHPDDRARVEAALAAVAQQQLPQPDEYRLIWPDGSVRYVWSQTAEQARDEQGRIIRLSGIVQDITERKLAEIALREAHNRMSALNRAAYLASSTLDPLRILQMACTELAAAFAATRVAAAALDEAAQGYRFVAQSECPTDEPIVGRMCQSADSPAAAYIERYNIPLVIDAANRQQYLPPQRPAWIQTALMIPLKVRSRAHGILCVEFDHARLFTDDEVAFAASFGQTISPAYENSLLHQQMMAQNAHLEQMVAERTAQLQRLNDRVTTILNNASDAIILVNRSHQIENTNLSFDRTFGYDRDELFGQPVNSLIEPEHQADFIKAIQQAWGADQPQRLETRAHCKDGRTFDADIAIAHVRDNDSHVVCSIRDITHIKEVERVKDQFVSMVSHELRTPVSAIMLSADIIANYYDRLTDEQKLYKLQQIRQQAAILTELMTAILDTSRVSARRDQPRLDMVDAAQALRDVVAELLPQADSKMQQLRVLADAPAWVRGDYTDFSRIWRNLIGNAIKYTQNGGMIRVSLVKTASLNQAQAAALPDFSAFNGYLPANLLDGDWLVGVVSDNGPGMSEQDQAQLFTRFFRGWAAATAIPGSGLGLSLVKEILETYGGDIAVHSALNQGTTFCFWIPVEKGNTS